MATGDSKGNGRTAGTILLENSLLKCNRRNMQRYEKSYWGAGNYLFWASATRRINAAGINVCATNNAGARYFVPGRSYAEAQSFINAAGRLGVSIF